MAIDRNTLLQFYGVKAVLDFVANLENLEKELTSRGVSVHTNVIDPSANEIPLKDMITKVQKLEAEFNSFTSKNQIDVSGLQEDLATLKHQFTTHGVAGAVNVHTIEQMQNQIGNLNTKLDNIPTMMTEKDRETLVASINGLKNTLYKQIVQADTRLQAEIDALKQPTWKKIQPNQARWGDRLRVRVGAKYGESLFGVKTLGVDQFAQGYLNAEYAQEDINTGDKGGDSTKENDTAYIRAGGKYYSLSDSDIMEIWRYE